LLNTVQSSSGDATGTSATQTRWRTSGKPLFPCGNGRRRGFSLRGYPQPRNVMAFGVSASTTLQDRPRRELAIFRQQPQTREHDRHERGRVTGGTQRSFGGLATREGPMALRTTLAGGVPLSRHGRFDGPWALNLQPASEW